LYKAANIVFDAKDAGELFYERAEPYRVESGTPEFCLSITEEELEQCRKESPRSTDRAHMYVLSGTKFYFELIKRGGMLLHSSAVVKDGRAYLFTANPGVGKSTHTGYWLRLFPDAYILNDDKPALRRENGVFCAYGTPWSGKYDISRNEGVPVGGIACIERAKTNFIEPMPTAQAAARILSQTVRHVRKERMDELLTTLDLLLREVPIYRLGCINDISAAEVSSETMLKNVETMR
jgi:hypothetical protein